VGDPTTAQRKLFAKMGLAMPDGSYYIRNGEEGASDLDNAIRAVGRGEDGDPSSGDPIRVHIIKRAKALGLSSKIPDTWNSDGSLKHEGGIVGQFLEHYGVKGMHWNSTLQAQADAAAKQLAAQRAGTAPKGAKKLDPHQMHLLHIAHVVHKAALAQQAHNKKIMGLKTLARQVKGAQKTAVASKISKAQAAHQATMNAAAAQVQASIDKIKAMNATHSGDQVGEFLEHFGVRGMHWGVRKARSSEPDSMDHAATQAIRAKAKAGGGIHVLSNDELQTLVTRLNLEQSHARLTADPGNVKKGHQFVKEGLGIAKTALDVYNTGKQVKDVVDDLTKPSKAA
jgi:hypothetical protein